MTQQIKAIDVIVIVIIFCLGGAIMILSGLGIIFYVAYEREDLLSGAQEVGFGILGYRFYHPVTIAVGYVIEGIVVITGSLLLLKLSKIGWWIILILTLHGIIESVLTIHLIPMASSASIVIGLGICGWLMWRRPLFRSALSENVVADK